ncbi:MAG TPA: DNA translocase FtsK [Candidatus Sulfotelmatobacter sp.]|nr:DNA translocase FtsK [Candidatus Sulfotelmatobacter sp.]
MLSHEQKRELTGVITWGSGLVLFAILAIPGGGTVAAPIHDRLLAALGLGAWLASAGLVITGARLSIKKDWKVGILAALGCALTVFAVLGILGLMAPGSGGYLGQRVGPGAGQRLGSLAAAASMVVIAFLGLVLAVDLRLGTLLVAAGSWLQEQRARRDDDFERGMDVSGAESSVGLDEPGAKAKEAPLNFPPVRLEQSTERAAAQPIIEAAPAPVLPPESLAMELARESWEQPADEQQPLPAGDPNAFSREFEGTPEPRELAAIPDVALPHASEDARDEEAGPTWVLPGSNLLDTITGKRERLAHEVQLTGATIVSTLKSFGIDTKLVGANSGPTVTQYEIQPALGVPVRKIVSCQTDLSLALAAHIRIQPFIPGKSAIGIEVPNKAAQLVTLKEIVQSSAFSDSRNRLSVALGADVSGHPVVGDLTRMPHLLIAGATGSGKSVCINAVLGGFLLQATPAELKLILVDPKRVELNGFADVPHLLVPVVVEPEAAVAALRWAVREMEERYKLFASHTARNIAAFNDRAPGLGLAPLPYIVVVIDELADLMIVAAGEIEDLICRIAQLARAVGIHLIVATQRPSADIITGLIKANIPSRVAFAVSSGVDSRVILDEMGAEKLLGRGDMLYLPIDEGKPRRLQGAFVSDRELEALIDFWKSQGKPDYQEEVFTVEATVSWAKEAGKRDPLFAKAAHTVAAEGRAAASLLQRKLSIGYTRAARLIDQLGEYRVVGPYEGSKSREVLMDVLQVDELLAELGEE